jgi:hypothetical protein
MTWTELSAQMAADEVAIHGEPVTLPTGEVMGVVWLPGSEPIIRERESRTGAQVTVENQMRPVVWLRTVDANGLLEEASVTIRETEYLVVSMTPDGNAMTRVALMLPGSEPAPLPEWRQWR